MKTKFYIIICLLLLSGISCRFSRAFVTDDVSYRELGVIAVIEFENLTDYVNAGRDVTYVFISELFTNKFNVMPEYELKRIVTEKKIKMKELLKQNKIPELGKQLGADNIIIGSVSEYRYKHGLGDDPAVGVNVRMISTSTGAVIWASSASKSGGRIFLHDMSLNEAAQRVCRKIVRDLYSQLGK